jgi:SAP domain
MVNLRSHDPFSGHAPTVVVDDAGDGGDDPIQPITPGEHPPPPVTQPPVEGDQEHAPTDGLDGMLKTELADLAAAMGLSTSGTKAELIDRIRSDRANSPK